MSEKKLLFDRRSMLRATAGTAAALSGVGAVSASSHQFGPGDCVVVVDSAASYAECQGLLSYPVDDGTTGKVRQTCKDAKEYYIAWDDPNAYDGWVDESSLDPC